MKQLGTITESVVPVRGAASHRAEMVNQLLWGECFELLAVEEEWWHIASLHDGYRGYIDPIMATLIDAQPTTTHRVATFFATVVCTGGEAHPQQLPQGALLHRYDPATATFELASEPYQLLQGEVTTAPMGTVDQLLTTARGYLGTPYLWGGRSPMGIDCSGYMQQLHAQHGIALPRDARDQATVAKPIPLAQAKGGDLAFFANPSGAIVHVGMLLDAHTIIHASGRVRIDTLDSRGIYNHNRQCYTHTLCGVGQIVND